MKNQLPGRWSMARTNIALLAVAPILFSANPLKADVYSKCKELAVLKTAESSNMAACQRILSKGDAESARNRAMAHYSMAKTFEAEQPAQAIEHFNRAIELVPNNFVYLSGRGLAFAAQMPEAADGARKEQLLAAAMDDFGRAANANPQADPYYTAGDVFEVRGETSLALVFFSKSIEQNSSWPGYLRRGLLNRKLGKDPEAAADLRKVASMAPPDLFLEDEWAKAFRDYGIKPPGRTADSSDQDASNKLEGLLGTFCGECEDATSE